MRTLALILLAACSTDTATFHEDIRPVIDQSCVSCHREGGIGPMDLSDETVVETWKEAIVASVAAGSMPPWGMDPDCRDVKGSQVLSDDTIAAFTRWADGDFEWGDPSDYVAPVVPDVEPPPDPDITLDFGAVS